MGVLAERETVARVVVAAVAERGDVGGVHDAFHAAHVERRQFAPPIYTPAQIVEQSQLPEMLRGPQMGALLAQSKGSTGFHREMQYGSRTWHCLPQGRGSPDKFQVYR